MTDRKVGHNIIVHGVVQGVFYRAFTKESAQKFNITGWVRNNRDGTVEALAFGSTDNMELFIAALRQGPTASRVDTLDITPVEFDGSYNNFNITS